MTIDFIITNIIVIQQFPINKPPSVHIINVINSFMLFFFKPGSVTK